MVQLENEDLVKQTSDTTERWVNPNHTPYGERDWLLEHKWVKTTSFFVLLYVPIDTYT